MVEFKDYYQINPSIFNREIKKGKRVKEGFNYSSNENKNFLSKNEISKYFNF